MLNPTDIMDELSTWSDEVLKLIGNQKCCSHFFLKHVVDELLSRGFTPRKKEVIPPKPEPKKPRFIPDPVKRAMQMTMALDAQFDSMFPKRRSIR